jgi:DNA invertase Pin-like site-specific DNA recombinase
MADGKFISYLRVSTQKQDASGLGLEAQREAVSQYLNGGLWEVMGEFLEVETGKGADALSKRPKLREALALCKKTGVTLLIAKLDRLARNVHFVSGLLETGIEFVACDMPNANKTMLQMFSVMAEWERDAISARTKAALSAAKARGVVLGAAGALNLKPNIEARKAAADAYAETLREVLMGFRTQGLTQAKQVERLNALRLPTASGAIGNWNPKQLQRVMARLEVMQQT